MACNSITILVVNIHEDVVHQEDQIGKLYKYMAVLTSTYFLEICSNLIFILTEYHHFYLKFLKIVRMQNPLCKVNRYFCVILVVF